jgi:hypothetical protein
VTKREEQSFGREFFFWFPFSRNFRDTILLTSGEGMRMLSLSMLIMLTFIPYSGAGVGVVNEILSAKQVILGAQTEAKEIIKRLGNIVFRL